jgi:hypothetical protein
MPLDDYDDHCWTARAHLEGLALACQRAQVLSYSAPLHESPARPWEWLCLAHSSLDGGEVLIRPTRGELGLHEHAWKSRPRYLKGLPRKKYHGHDSSVPVTRTTPCRSPKKNQVSDDMPRCKKQEKWIPGPIRAPILSGIASDAMRWVRQDIDDARFKELVIEAAEQLRLGKQ